MLSGMDGNEQDQPQYPLTSLASSAAANHEFVITHVEAGFTRQEAMQLLMVVIWFGLMKNS